MIRNCVLALVLLSASSAVAATPPASEQDRIFHAIGQNVYRSLSVFNLSQAEFDQVIQGVTDSYHGKKSDIELSDYNAKIQELARTRRKQLGEKQAAAAKEFIEKAAQEKGAVKTSSGMVYLPLVEGSGNSPAAADTVKVNYRGTLVDGTEFDSSYKRGKPLEFRLDAVIKCWTEGVQKMKPGGKARFVCPANLAYGDNGVGEMILPGATLNFEVELLGVKKAEALPKPMQADAPKAVK